MQTFKYEFLNTGRLVVATSGLTEDLDAIASMVEYEETIDLEEYLESNKE